jgi:DNA polymerase-1
MKYLLIDGNSIGRASHCSTKLTIGDEEVQAIYGTLRTIQALLKTYPNAKPVVLWDGRAQWRYDLFPLYKGTRADNPQKIAETASYHLQQKQIRVALTHLGVQQVLDKDAEADDLAGYISRKLDANGNHITLITGDKDWQQLVTANVDWLDHRTNGYVNAANFKDVTGYKNSNQFVEAKCLMGDSSDNIPGVGGIGEKWATELMERYESVDSFLSIEHDRSTMPKPHRRFADNESPFDSVKFGKMLPAQDAFVRNMKLMKLDNYTPHKSTLKLEGGSTTFNKSAFIDFCHDRLFHSILTQLDSWIAPFQQLGESA